MIFGANLPKICCHLQQNYVIKLIVTARFNLKTQFDSRPTGTNAYPMYFCIHIGDPKTLTTDGMQPTAHTFASYVLKKSVKWNST